MRFSVSGVFRLDFVSRHFQAIDQGIASQIVVEGALYYTYVCQDDKDWTQYFTQNPISLSAPTFRMNSSTSTGDPQSGTNKNDGKIRQLLSMGIQNSSITNYFQSISVSQMAEGQKPSSQVPFETISFNVRNGRGLRGQRRWLGRYEDSHIPTAGCLFPLSTGGSSIRERRPAVSLAQFLGDAPQKSLGCELLVLRIAYIHNTHPRLLVGDGFLCE